MNLYDHSKHNWEKIEEKLLEIEEDERSKNQKFSNISDLKKLKSKGNITKDTTKKEGKRKMRK